MSLDDLKKMKTIIEESQKKAEPVEKAFLAYVVGYKSIGYMRQIDLILEQWEKELGVKRFVVIDKDIKEIE